jgi:L-ascorbate metabolism protein UlaG (beta-lactamase superfamily)
MEGNMEKMCFLVPLLVMVSPAVTAGQAGYEKDVIKTSAGDLEITFFGHATFMLSFQGKLIHVDPVSQYADYAKLPKADIILITHEHRDHLDPAALEKIRTDRTQVILPEACAAGVPGALVMKNGETNPVDGFKIEAVPAYNLVHMRSPGMPFHPKGAGNGYVITLGNERVYIAGDSENTPEMKSLKSIDIAFLPMNLPYTMTPEMVADAAKAMKPKILYPYHFGDTDTSKLTELMKDTPGVQVRIRKMK